MFETEKLIINSWNPDLAENFFLLSQDDGFNLFPINSYRQKNLESARAWTQKMQEQNNKTRLGKYAVLEKVSLKLIGIGGLTPWTFEEEEMIDITYRLHSSAIGKGLGLELASGLVIFGFETLKLDEITATITRDNIPSKKIADKLGLKFDRHITLLGVATDLYRLRR